MANGLKGEAECGAARFPALASMWWPAKRPNCEINWPTRAVGMLLWPAGAGIVEAKRYTDLWWCVWQAGTIEAIAWRGDVGRTDAERRRRTERLVTGMWE